ncbi:Putative secreted protein [Streptomyces venezuelae]|nr:Putative secreted protein [Streptomyces venezuelae]
MSLALLLTTAAATAVGAAALHAVHGLRKEVTGLRTELAAARGVTVPAARATPAAEIRAAVAEALAEERERELAEARAFWAAQEARDAADAPSLLGGLGGPAEDGTFFVPRQADFAGLEAMALEAMEAEAAALDGIADLADPLDEFPEDSAELAAARRRHPSHPDFVPVQTPVVTDHERTVARLEELADTRTALTDVRPGPLGTLDVYVFADGTTLCMTPGHRETAERLAEALRSGRSPVLLGGSGVSGAFALTFSYGDTDEENVYILADRVIASL